MYLENVVDVKYLSWTKGRNAEMYYSGIALSSGQTVD